MATLSLCAARVCRLVSAEVVRDAVEENLLLHPQRLPAIDADQLIENYRRLIKLTEPEVVPSPGRDSVRSSRHLIRYAADVPVLLPAMASKPDWLLTHNTRHFTKAVAVKTAAAHGQTRRGFPRSLLAFSLNYNRERIPRWALLPVRLATVRFDS